MQKYEHQKIEARFMSLTLKSNLLILKISINIKT